MAEVLKKTKWQGQREAYLQALHYLDGRRKGKIKSFRTPWKKMNDAGVDGLEWNSMIIIGGRPGTGKTLIKSQIVREAFKLNPGMDMRVLEFQFEMMARVSAVREFSSVLGKSYKHLCSADRNHNGELNKLSDEELRVCHEYAKKRVEYPIDIVENPTTIKEYEQIIHKYMDAYSVVEKYTDNAGQKKTRKVYKKTLITLDHSYLIKCSGNKTEMLYELGETCTKLKRQYPIIFIILSQLKRETDRPERNEDGKYGNYILESDIFGGDALTQHADMIVGVNIPAKRFIKFYGPDRFIIEDEQTMVWHFIKCRNGDIRMSFFKAEFNRMAVTEIPTPGRQQKNISSKNVS